MTEAEIPDHNIFMMCEKLNASALTGLREDFHFRNCRPDELELWKAFPFDSEKVPEEHEDFMNRFVAETYGKDMDLFFRNTLFVCDRDDRPVATCSSWKSYGRFHAIHWLKTRKAYEGKGIGRALLSKVMTRFDAGDYPVYLHTQPGSFRAIKLYSDFGFCLLRGGRFGTRTNDLEKCLPILEEFMPEQDFRDLEIREAPATIQQHLRDETAIQF